MNELLEILEVEFNEAVENYQLTRCLGEKQEFQIDNDRTAEWALNIMAESKREAQRIISACEMQIEFYKRRIDAEKLKLDRKISYFQTLLEVYFAQVDASVSKSGTEKYSLPSGDLVRKFPTPEIVKDDAKLLEFVKKTAPEFVKVAESPMWGELKKRCTISNGKAILDTGEIVDGITAVQRPPVFEVKLK